MTKPWFVDAVELNTEESRVNKSGLTPMCKVVGLILRHLENILTSVATGSQTGVVQGLNSKIMPIKRKVCGGLDLYPVSAGQGLPTENPEEPDYESHYSDSLL